MANNPNEPKTFSLTGQEREELVQMRAHFDSIFSARLSVLANSRLGYNITENTQFTIEPDFSKVTIREASSKEVDKATKSSSIKTS